jgi:hypothetical protein
MQGDKVVRPSVAFVDIIVMIVDVVEVLAIVLEQAVVNARHAFFFETGACTFAWSISSLLQFTLSRSKF